MKLLLILALAIVPGLQVTSGIRASSYGPVEKGIKYNTEAHSLEGKNAVNSGETGATQFTEENAASAKASKLYDTIMPPLCLLLVLWLSLSIPETKNRNVL